MCSVTTNFEILEDLKFNGHVNFYSNSTREFVLTCIDKKVIFNDDQLIFWSVFNNSTEFVPAENIIKYYLKEGEIELLAKYPEEFKNFCNKYKEEIKILANESDNFTTRCGLHCKRLLFKMLKNNNLIKENSVKYNLKNVNYDTKLFEWLNY